MEKAQDCPPRLVGHMDLWEKLLQEIAAAGPSATWMHVLSHVGVPGNTKADTLADMGC